MRRGCGSLTWLVPIVLQACGGGDGPAAPTQMPPPTVTPIVVTITAQVTDNPAAANLRGFQDQGIIEKRNVRVTGEVRVTGGNATVGATVTFTAGCRIVTSEAIIPRSLSMWRCTFQRQADTWRLIGVQPRPTPLFPFRRLEDIPG